LPFDAESFDAILCECAFCTFPDKRTAAAEFFRVLKSGGRVGISDLTRTPAALPELDGLVAWIACIGDARPLERYAQWLAEAGLSISVAQQRDHHLRNMVESIRARLLIADVMRGLGKLDIPGLDIAQANRFARAASAAIHAGQLGYGVLVACKPLPE
jgi:ubiquinone/menaquinone biosynthesis C-methylase UbiE